MRAFASHERLTLRSFAASLGVSRTIGAAGFCGAITPVREDWDVIFRELPSGGDGDALAATTRTPGPSLANLGRAQRSVTSTKLVSAGGGFVVSRPGSVFGSFP